ncbi:homing endonuclease [Bacillus phage vB_BmeM-Goe8]|uniref:DUF2726 domain-containing protein n=1 Tax=Bacillus phage vB_BmeM-Goe8 TaxID=2593638 RepID=A0A516KN25_9CAUD|nr:homing endonuclease [Bacillus phage vB_BmeM-Goe8]QDP42977.1 hypothetical protein Goe8_c02040 [Bacillus phage vB_BmeM-Goe8]
MLKQPKTKTLSLEDKKKLASSRGYTLLADNNFDVKTKVYLQKESDDFVYETFWDNFTRGITPKKTTLKSKKQYALDRGYILNETDNFGNRANVTVVEMDSGIEYIVQWGRFIAGATPKMITLEGKRTIAKSKGYTLLETEDFSTAAKVWLRNDETNEKYHVKFSNFFHKGYRGDGTRSIGEAIVLAYLKENLLADYTFQREYRVDYAPKRKGFYDFCITTLDKQNILAFIEYDGIQHFQPTFGIESFNSTQRSDKAKTKYAEEKGIPLLRIPYTTRKEKDIARCIQAAFPSLVEAEIKQFVPKQTRKGENN